jgi:hypothetical protein
MRLLLALILILGSAATASAQRPPSAGLQSASRVVVSDGVFRGEMPTASARYTGDWPMVIVPARPLRIGVDPTVPEFRIRAWQERQGVRVVVFGITASARGQQVREQQIATVFVPINQYVEIAATEKFRARRLTLTAYTDGQTPQGNLGAPAPWRIEPRHIDIPVRPWMPPQK